MGRKTVWVFYRWMQHNLHKEWVYIISSKSSWQLNRAIAKAEQVKHPNRKCSFELLCETHDKAVIEKMKELMEK